MSQPRRGPKRKHYTVTFEPDVWERWTEIGLFEGFQSDSSVARFLLSLYSTAGGENGKLSDRRCVGCHTILPLLCTKCQFPSCVDASSQAFPKAQATETLSSKQAVVCEQGRDLTQATPPEQVTSTEGVVSCIASIQPTSSKSVEATSSKQVLSIQDEVAPYPTPFVQTMHSIQAAASTQSTSLLQATLSTQVLHFVQDKSASASQANLSLQAASVSELMESSTPVTTSVTQATTTSTPLLISSFPSPPSTQTTPSVKILAGDTSSLSDPSNYTADSFVLPASPSDLPTLGSDLINSGVNTSDAYSLEHESGFGQNHDIIDMVEPENSSVKRTACKNKQPVENQTDIAGENQAIIAAEIQTNTTAENQLNMTSEIQNSLAITENECAQASFGVDDDNNKLGDALEEDDTFQQKNHDNDNVSETAPAGTQNNSPKKKGKKVKQTVKKKEKSKCRRTRLKGIVGKIDPVVSSQEDAKTNDKPADEKLITYEPKTVLGPGKKIGKYYYYSQYVCACCDKVFPGKTEFNKHITEMKRQQERISHRKYERKRKKCPECSQMVELGKEFTQHMKGHTTPKLTCSECHAEFISKREFARHIKAHQGERPFLCTICGNGFKHAGQLSNHMVTHRTVRAFMCSVCGMAFKSAGILRGHEATHTGERKFQCQQCGRNFARKHTLNVHMLVHTPVKPYKCNQCDASFVNGTKLRYHMTIHTNPMAFKCEECAATFRCPTSLRNHRRIHTGEKPCICNICNKTFGRPAYLRNHLKFHSDEKPYKCKHCIHAFRKRGSLNHHLKSAHPEMFPAHTASGSPSAIPTMQTDGFPTTQLIVVMTAANEDGENFSE